MEHSRNFDEQNFDELMVAFIGNTLRGKVSVENFDESIANRQNSSDFSSVKILRYTVTLSALTLLGLHSQGLWVLHVSSIDS